MAEVQQTLIRACLPCFRLSIAIKAKTYVDDDSNVLLTLVALNEKKKNVVFHHVVL